MSDQETLVSMGFPENRVTRALKAGGNLQGALDWLEAKADVTDEALAAGDAQAAENDDGDTAMGADDAKSLKCMECGKIFRNHALASYHGEKSGHDQFEESTEEIKPLTEDEKAAKLAELRERMLAKKALNAKREAEEFKRNEDIRRKGGKDQAQIKADLALKAAEKDAAEKKRDKLEDAKAKAAVRAQIEADKKARVDKAAREKALREGRAPPVVADAPAPTPTASVSSGEKKVYTQTRLQIRLPSGGQPLVHSVNSTATLGEVIEYVKTQTALPSVTLSSAFPRKTYSGADESKTMKELGLAPSAVLMIS